MSISVALDDTRRPTYRASPSSETFSLPAGPQWSAISTFGFMYRDSLGTNGPVKVAQMR